LIAKPKGEIAAVVSLAAGALVATGYGITTARLHDVGVPASTALGALPASYFLGEALQATVLPLVLLLSVGVIWLALNGAKGLDQKESRRLLGRIPWLPSWAGLALLLMASAWLIDVLTHHGEFDGANWEYWLVIGALLVVVPVLVGIAAPQLFRPQQQKDEMPETTTPPVEGEDQPKQAGDEAKSAKGDPAQRRRVQITLAILLTALISVVGASTIRIANAAFLDDTLPAVLVSAKPGNCTLLGPNINTGHCYFKGFYLGENGQWLFLIWKPTTPMTDAAKRKAVAQLHRKKPDPDLREIEQVEKEALEKIRNRLILVPRDDVLQVLEADKTSELPEV
jgi:uncharacterized membrane protein YhaH (DUF805 family)